MMFQHFGSRISIMNDFKYLKKILGAQIWNSKILNALIQRNFRYSQLAGAINHKDNLAILLGLDLR